MKTFSILPTQDLLAFYFKKMILFYREKNRICSNQLQQGKMETHFLVLDDIAAP